MPTLLAVDLGLKTGLALYGQDGRLMWYRSKNFGSPKSLRAGAHTLLKQLKTIQHVVVEGRGELGDIWFRECRKREIDIQFIDAEKWRKDLLYSRHQRTGLDAKHYADQLAIKTIIWAGAPKPATKLRHDTAEAILIGLWAVKERGWLNKYPEHILLNR